jgi:hypothetical protein
MVNRDLAICLTLLILLLTVAGCSSESPAPGTPTEALMAYVSAQQQGDIATMKRLLSRGSIAFIETNARVQNKTVDDILRDETRVKIANLPVTRNEKIDGETATVEVRDDTTGQFDLVYPFVREDGVWKLARDKQIEALLKKANDSRERLVSDVANASRSNSNSNSNK